VYEFYSQHREGRSACEPPELILLAGRCKSRILIPCVFWSRCRQHQTEPCHCRSHYHDLYSYGTCGMAHEIFLEDRGTTRRVRPLPGHPTVPRSLCPVQPFSISPGRPNAALEGKLTPPLLSRNLEQSSIQRLDWTNRARGN
jgi:hypothetical protein